MNAVVYRVPGSEVKPTDTREAGYCRVKVASDQYKLLSGSIPKDAQVWIYLVPKDKINSPSPDYPIVQSYVDIVLKGCMQVAQNFSLPTFTTQCVTTTDNWSQHWVNDRLLPRRPFIYEPKAEAIDKLLQETLPVYYPLRSIE